MKATNIILIALGGLAAYLFLRSKVKSETTIALKNALRPTALVMDNPQIAPVGTIDPPKIILARASALVPEVLLSGEPVGTPIVYDDILASAKS
jgi:hypothetical protein